MTRFLTVFFAAAAALAFAAPHGAAAAAASRVTEYATTEIVSERPGFSPGETTWFAIRQTLREGWHAFWINPGDAGIPLELTWNLADGFEVGEIVHPAPEYIPVGPLASYAHEGEPVFLVPVTAPADLPVGEPVRVEISALWQVCREICILEEAQFAFDMPVLAASEPSPDQKPLFARAREAAPSRFEGAARLVRAGDRLDLQIENWSVPRARDIFFFPAIEGATKPAAKQRASIKDGTLTVSMEPGWTSSFGAGVAPGVLAYRDAGGERTSVWLDAVVEAAPPAGLRRAVAASAAQAGPAPLNAGVLLAMAFLGGVILNAMPCVFPIIFIKAAALTHSAHGHPGELRRDGLIYTAGVMASFLAMGGLLLALRAGGQALGWGFQLQSPALVAVFAYILFLVGLNLAGLFTVGESVAGSGEGLARRGGAGGAFFTGVLAVVVAAPCIGPLLAAPMGAALLAPAPVGLAIFAMLALGMAAPFIALSFTPALGRYLPAPGPWMRIFKQILAFPVFAAAVYFIWVLAQQTGANAVGAVLGGAVLLSLAAWMFENSKARKPRAAIILRVAAALLAAAALVPLTRIAPAEAAPKGAGAYGKIDAVAYDAQLLNQYRDAQTPVFIDFTAAWCVTCQFNKLTVLNSPEIAEAFARTGTVLMVADWTVRDPAITKALESFGAPGVPLYVYYGPSGEATILPQALSKKAVLEALLGAGES